MSDSPQLLAKIRQLEHQLHEKEQDITFFQNELSKINHQLEKLVMRTQQELKMAGKIHQILVPTEFPDIPGFEFSTKFTPSAKMGGDYFDIFDHPGKMKFGGVVSSASSYGLSAVMMSVLLKYTGLRLLQDCKNAKEAVQRMREDILADSGPEDAVNLVCFQVDRKSYELSLVSLGEAAVFYYDYSDAELKELEPGGAALGHSANASKFETHFFNLNPRDRLVICSPGFFAQTNLQDEFFTRQQLREAIAPVAKSSVHELKNEILFQLEKFASGVEAARDQTVLVIEVKDRVIKLAKG